MAEVRDSYTIAQFSDIHCGDKRFDPSLMEALIDEVNHFKPDLLVMVGDLTADGYREQFEEAHGYIKRFDSPNMMIVPGNHDTRNVGYLHFEEIFGPRNKLTAEYDFGVRVGGDSDQVQEHIRLLSLDSNKPDLNDGEIGRDHYRWIDAEFGSSDDFKLFIIHHHLVSIPGTGRERNVVWDAGDVLERLRNARVDLVLCGHRHVPFSWPIADMLIVSSGTASTWRTRGYTQPSYNSVTIEPDTISVRTKVPGGRIAHEEKFSRRRTIIFNNKDDGPTA